MRIATRESPLALWQANYVADELRRVAPGCLVELVLVSTAGDRDRSEALSQLGGLGVFTREVQRAVLNGAADLAVHSLKDLPTDPAPGLALAGISSRGPRYDALILPLGTAGDLASLQSGARVGTGSPRRQSLLLSFRPELQLVEIRGNVETRIHKVDAGEYDAVILAEAGLHRLGLQNRISQVLSPPILFPAVGQAALGIECREDDVEVRKLLELISDPSTTAEVLAERACLRTLRAGCHAPVGVLSAVAGESLTLETVVLSRDGTKRFQAVMTGRIGAPEDLGEAVARRLLHQGAAALLAMG